ncbi:MAG: glycosyltransferase [bacterium]|nr:glycosyltransferase [bacterium]
MILYLSHSRLKNSVNAVYIKGLVQSGKSVEAHGIKKSLFGYFDALKKISKIKPDVIIVGYDSPQLVIFCRLFTRKKIVYNALCSVYERMIVARGLYSKFSLPAIYYWLLDFFAVKAANLVMLETDSQISYFSKLFKVSRKKLVRAWTGVDEDIFFYDPAATKFLTFTVLFRGSLMPESGAEYVIQAAKILERENIKFIMLSGGLLLDKISKLVEELKPTNLEFRSDLLSIEELRTIMQKCHLSLGQLSDHPRLERTIPHKAYESLAMHLPYLTASNAGILELLTAGETCITCRPADARSVAEKIMWAKNNPQELEKIAQNGYQLFQEKLRSNILAKNLLDNLSGLI